MFKKARIQLTLFYTIILTIIIIVFSGIVFHLTNEHLRQQYTQIVSDDVDTASEKVVEGVLDELAKNLIVADLIIIALSAFLSYLLAGKTLEPIQTALDAQERFSSNASHELRTPLAVMKIENEVFFKDKSFSEENSHKLALSNLEEINRMTGIVENLLMLARSKKVDLNKKIEMANINLSEVIHNTIGVFQKSALAKHITIQQNLSQKIFVFGSAPLLGQVFSNILQNAITYTNQGTIQINAIIDHVIVIKIIDTGIGIDTKDIAHIFDPFFKADTARTVSSGGVGLGLSIVQEIVWLHKGSIHFDSKIGKGTMVTIRLPLSTQKVLSS